MTAPIHIGTSGWHYPHWRGVFYPREVDSSRWLSYYARHFSCVEINNSFYRLPEATVFSRWREETPADFRFSVKAPQSITHRKKLKDCRDILERFLAHGAALEDKLAVVLFQLPPRWHCNLQRLESFLQMLPRTLRCSFEFRDPSWHNEEVYALLRAHQAAFCIFELGELQAPEVTTSNLVYIRLHGPAGPYAGSYSAVRLRSWSEKLRQWQRRGHAAWVFFDNDQAGYAVKNARLLAKLVSSDAL
ncbi:MAG: DUF72 domain-containing protein [Gammaproteobacteria bacterium]